MFYRLDEMKVDLTDTLSKLSVNSFTNASLIACLTV